MARYVGPVCRFCRTESVRENVKLHFKGERCFTDKCALERRPHPPGQHGLNRRGKLSDYALRLREKQKVKRIYGLLESQFRDAFDRAVIMKGVTGENLLNLLERRLDNMVFRLGFASTRTQARQLVRHGHFRVNGKKTNVPSFKVRAGDRISLREKSRKTPVITTNLEQAVSRGIPAWLELNPAEFEGTVKAFPAREELSQPIQEQLIVELYSK